MLLGSTSSLRDLIIQALLGQGACSYAALRTAIGTNGGSYSKQAIYAELNNLIQQMVVMKRGSKFELRLCWLYELENLTRRRVQESVAGSGLKVGGREILKCRSLREMQGLWSSVAFELMYRDPKHIYYEWIEHCWFHLCDPRSDEQVLAQHQSLNVQYRMVLGGESTLSRAVLKLMSAAPGGYCVVNRKVAGLAGMCLSVYDDTVIAIRLPNELCDAIDTFFKTHTVLNQTTIDAFHEIATAKYEISLTVARDAEKARQFRDALNAEFERGPVTPFSSSSESPARMASSAKIISRAINADAA